MKLQMKQKGILTLHLSFPLVIFLLFLAPPSVGGTCVSSCGSIKNISHPFRLADDSSNCGMSQYQLTCQDNQTLFNLFGRLHLVRGISYENQTITLVDLGLLTQSNTNCSTSLPTSCLMVTWSNFLLPVDDVMTFSFVSCQQPVVSDDDSYYNWVSESPCNITNSATNDNHHYYLPPKKINVVDFIESCTYYEFLMLDPQHFASVLRRTTFLGGFQLSWSVLQCPECEAAGGHCVYLDPFSYLDGSYTCRIDHSCRNAHQSKHCFFHYLRQTLRAFGFTVLNVAVYVGYVLATRSGIGMLCLFSFVIYKLRRQHLRKNQSVEQFLDKYRNLTPTRYSYREIKRMTGGFKEKLGQGGFGSVFKGTLAGGHRLVAVKMLSKSIGDGEEFINEVATIGRIHHVNVVQLIGFCSDGSKRALVYDFMHNGSLDKYIYNKQGHSSGGSSAAMLGVQKMYEIALGTARGIEYLHRGCEMQILHFDIKPQNILLDADFNPKISDFGLAKLYPTGKSAVSLTNAKGTPGFIAPEMVYRNLGHISYKSDVYSFGRLLLEMIGQMNDSNPKVAAECVSGQFYFPAWLYDQMMKGEDVVAVDTVCAEMVESESAVARRLVVVGLCCIQMKPDDRPSMQKVVEMLQATTNDLPMPPRPALAFPPEVEMIVVETEWLESSALVDDEDSTVV